MGSAGSVKVRGQVASDPVGKSWNWMCCGQQLCNLPAARMLVRPPSLVVTSYCWLPPQRPLTAFGGTSMPLLLPTTTPRHGRSRLTTHSCAWSAAGCWRSGLMSVLAGPDRLSLCAG